MASCSSLRVLEKDELLLSTVKVESSDKHISKHSIKSIILQKPNSKWFGITKAPLGIYCLAGQNDSSGISKILRKIGEPPVKYDDVSTKQSLKSIRNYLVQKGFRQGYAEYDTLQTKHKVHLTYKLNCGPRTYIRNISSSIQNAGIEEIVKKLESGNVTLEESIDLYSMGAKLATECSKLLENAKLTIKTLSDAEEETND